MVYNYICIDFTRRNLIPCGAFFRTRLSPFFSLSHSAFAADAVDRSPLTFSGRGHHLCSLGVSPFHQAQFSGLARLQVLSISGFYSDSYCCFARKDALSSFARKDAFTNASPRPLQACLVPLFRDAVRRNSLSASFTWSLPPLLDPSLASVFIATVQTTSPRSGSRLLYGGPSDGARRFASCCHSPLTQCNKTLIGIDKLSAKVRAV